MTQSLHPFFTYFFGCFINFYFKIAINLKRPIVYFIPLTYSFISIGGGIVLNCVYIKQGGGVETEKCIAEENSIKIAEASDIPPLLVGRLCIKANTRATHD